MTVHGGPSGDTDEVKAALTSIVSDPDYGAPALSSRRAMESLLKDLLPDRPRDAAILVAAAEYGIAASLSERVEREGMDASVAVRLVAASFSQATAFTPEACQWAATELADALGMDTTAIPSAPPPSLSQPGPGQPGAGQPAQEPREMRVPRQAGPLASEPITAPVSAWPGQPVYAQPGYAQPGYAQPGYARPGPPQPAAPAASPGRRRTALTLTAGGLAAVVAVVLIVVLHKHPGPVPVITVSASSDNSPSAGNVYVYYSDPGQSTATISGMVSRVGRGEIAALTAQPFPFARPPRVIARTPIAARNQDLSFLVTPSLETRYRIEVLPSPDSGTPLATSAARTVYVALVARPRYTRNSCPRPKCTVTIQLTVPVAPAALHAEEAKRILFYWAIHRVPSGPEPSSPTTLSLQDNLSFSTPV
ncbi:MAG TPA: hypothetical protein VF843_03645, partial [Streptosporangiaceae bacterium]